MIWTATLSSKGQLTLPKALRERLKLKPGDKVLFIVRGERVELEPARGDILQWYGALKTEETHDWREVREQVRRAIAEEVVREGQGH